MLINVIVEHYLHVNPSKFIKTCFKLVKINKQSIYL